MNFSVRHDGHAWHLVYPAYSTCSANTEFDSADRLPSRYFSRAPKREGGG